MKDIFILTFLIILFSISSCRQIDPNKQIDEGKVDKNIYTSENIGWTIEIPDGWTIVEKDKSEEYDNKGLKAIDEVTDGEIDFIALRRIAISASASGCCGFRQSPTLRPARFVAALMEGL